MVVTMTVAGLVEVAAGSALVGGVIGGVGVKIHDMLKAGDYVAQYQQVGRNNTQVQIAHINNCTKDNREEK